MKSIKTLVATITGLAIVAATSHASLTTVNDIWGANGAGGEWNLYNSGVGSSPGAGVMEYLYGNFTRVDDASDIQWIGSPGGATFDAIYAGAGQALYTAALAGTPISGQILSASGNMGSTPPARSLTTVSYTPVSQPFLFLDQANGNNAYSDPTLSTGGVDRMVTFAVTGYLTSAGNINTWTAFSDGTTHYVIAFEDGTDFDFNDLVVEVSGVTPVPEVGTVVAGALLLLPLGASTLRILRRK
ncbi:MAG TPA: hypothetical protein VMB80_11115 [Candidatus Acidoferrum sp.]|nr:hypothetical protein [Candidatus Acidoferrum sp.]